MNTTLNRYDGIIETNNEETTESSNRFPEGIVLFDEQERPHVVTITNSGNIDSILEN